VHIEETTLTCKVCSKIFTNVFKLKYHDKAAHSGQSFECDLCPFQASVKHLIQQHMQIHKKFRLKKFPCLKCGFEFVEKKSLNRHLSKKPATCFYCENKFDCKSLLENQKHKVKPN
jgi:hypothetical protein